MFGVFLAPKVMLALMAELMFFTEEILGDFEGLFWLSNYFAFPPTLIGYYCLFIEMLSET